MTIVHAFLLKLILSDLFPHNLLSVSSLEDDNFADTTPESLHSLERIFPNRHLLSNMSPGRLDRNFSDSPDESPRFSSTPSGENDFMTLKILMGILQMVRRSGGKVKTVMK